MFHNVLFKWQVIKPRRVAEKTGDRDSPMQVRDIPGETERRAYSYQLNRDGRYAFSSEYYAIEDSSGNTRRTLMPYFLGFDGSVFRSYSYDKDTGELGLGAVFLPEHPYDVSGPLIKPTFYMDHLFNEKVKSALADPANVTFTEGQDGLWQFRWVAPAAEPKDFLNIYCDPQLDFAITRLEGAWNEEETYTKEIVYTKAEEGFLYPVEGTLRVGDGEPSVLQVEAFELNGPEEAYAPEIPVGTRVTDYTRGKLAETYIQGQPGKELTLSGDPSIYSAAEEINRLALEGITSNLAEAGLSTSDGEIQPLPVARGQTPQESNSPAQPWLYAFFAAAPFVIVCAIAAYLLRSRRAGKQSS